VGIMDARGLQSIYYGSPTIPELRTEEAWKHVLEYVETKQPLVIYDQETKQDLRLTLLYAPRDQAFYLGADQFLVSLTMRSQKGDHYDLDFEVEGSAPSSWRIRSVDVRSVNGRARYQWFAAEGSLRQRPIS